MIVDVREPQEYQINRIAGLDPDPAWATCPSAIVELDPNANIVTPVQVGHAEREGARISFVRRVHEVRNLTGGVLGWIDQVDPSQPKY